VQAAIVEDLLEHWMLLHALQLNCRTVFKSELNFDVISTFQKPT